jgi:glycerophosphoryl diester phosphodiesterase
VSLEIAADMAGDWYRGLLLKPEPIPNWAEMADYLEATTINIDGRVAPREFIEEIMDTERQIIAYTINDPMLARQLRQWGVDTMITDDPDAVNDSLFKAH